MVKTLLYSVISVVILYVVEQYLEVNYLIKTVVKIGLFCVVPILLVRDFTFLKWSAVRKSSFLLTVGVALCGFFGILVGYHVLQSFIDPAAIVHDLTARLEISKTTFIFVAVYICLCNSFLEEFFFRGWLFQSLQKHSSVAAYVVSSLLFSGYHIAIFATWFHWSISLLALVGLFMVGILFCFINEKNGSMYHSWFIHMMANVAIILIGFQLL